MAAFIDGESGGVVIRVGGNRIGEGLGSNDRAAWREAIIRVVNDEALRADLRARGLARAATFTWQRTARLTLDAYREAVRAA